MLRRDRGSAQADGLPWLLRHIRGIATKRNNSQRMFGSILVLDGHGFRDEINRVQRDYCNGYRSHAGLKGETPVAMLESRGASLKSYRWRQHCRGLYQTPLAA
jgi:hypothetical protein